MVDLAQQGGERLHLGLNLVFGTKDVAIVLSEAAHAHDAVQTARGLVAVALAKLAKAQWQVAVALDALLVNQDVARAVHGLEGVVAFFTLGGEHVLAVLVPVAGFFPQGLVQDLRALHFQVIVVTVNLAHVLLDALPHRPPLGVPEHQAGRVVVDVEQIQFAAELAVVALFGFFQHGQVLLQVFLAGPGRAIDTLQHFIAMVAAPISAGHLHQLEMLELAGAGHVGAPAQVGEAAFAVERHIFAGGNAANDLGLVMLAQALEVLNRLVARQDLAQHRLVFVGQRRHALFNGLEVFRRERA